MKIEHSGSEVISTSPHKEHRFGVKQGAGMFKVLSSTLYSDKVRAIIRELACNAWDAHVAAGKPTTPFDLHLPTTHEPWFAIKDYGTGLSHDDILALFSTYFGSSKTTSNKFIGALGLGSKSPFCYTPMYNIKCTFQGITRVYEARVNADGEPTLQQMGNDVETPQLANGIEIKFPVKQQDIWEFENKAKSALEFFEPRPILNTNIEIVKPEYVIRTDRWGLRKTGSGIRAIMGNVQYAVGQIDISRLNSSTRRIGEMPLDIFFNIGDLSFTASREVLELDEQTVKNLTDAYGEIYESFLEAIKTKIDACAEGWEARLLVFGLTSAPGMGGIVNDAWNTGKLFGKYTNFNLEGNKPTLNDVDWSLTALVLFDHNRKATINAKKTFLLQGLATSDRVRERIADDPTTRKIYDRTIKVDPDVHFIINDLDKGGEKYVHYFVQVAASKENHGKKHVYVLTRTNKEIAIDAMIIEAKKMLAEIGNPKYEMASDLKTRYAQFIEKKERERRQRERTGRRKIVTLRSSISTQRYNGDGWSKAWDKSEQQPDGVKYYVSLERLKAIECGFSTAFNFLQFVNKVRKADVFGIDADTPIYGIRKNAKLRKDPNWVEFTSYVMQSVKKMMTPAKELQLALLLCPFQSDIYDGVLRQVAKEKPLSENSPFQKFADTLASVRAHRGLTNDAFKEVLDEAARRGYYKQGPIPNLNRVWEGVKRQYPLIDMVDHFNWNGRNSKATVGAVIEYVGLIDESRMKQEQAQKVELAMAAIAAGDDSTEVVQ